MATVTLKQPKISLGGYAKMSLQEFLKSREVSTFHFSHSAPVSAQSSS